MDNVKQVSDFKYLGSIIAEDASVQKEIQTRLQKASAAFSGFYQKVWSRKTLALKTKVSLYKTMVLPILTQDCETLPAKQNQLKQLGGFQHRLLTICNKKWEGFINYMLNSLKH